MTVEVTLGIRRCEQLATIFRAVASANRLSETLAKAYQPHHTIASQLAATLARNEPGTVRQLAMCLSRPVYRTERELGQGLLATPPSLRVSANTTKRTWLMAEWTSLAECRLAVRIQRSLAPARPDLAHVGSVLLT
jgi:hypothetical protein